MLAGILVYLLCMPFYFEINSVDEIIQFRLHHLARGTVLFKTESIFLQLRITWWQKEIDLLAIKGKPAKVKKVVKVKEKKALPKRIFRKLWAVIKSFQVRQCRISIDTGDMPANGLLFPVFYWIGRWLNKPVSINFNDENIVILEVKNNMARMLWAYLRA